MASREDKTRTPQERKAYAAAREEACDDLRGKLNIDPEE
jgi:hypothetical protein